MPRSSVKPLAEIFRANVLKMLKKEGLIDEDIIKMILKWRHTSGFSVDNSVRIKKDDSQGLTNLAQYIIRSPFSLSKLCYHQDSSMVTYRSKMSHGGNKKNFVVMNAEEFIAAITQHIPEKNFQLVRYYGWYSNHPGHCLYYFCFLARHRTRTPCNTTAQLLYHRCCRKWHHSPNKKTPVTITGE